ncbi:sensor histidine kinase [Sinomonas gamaensis]|uniref:sensor histidine kinase n=1 Tax=Sinomonas gamaensis TaxID=2565624 RepID=UPI00110808DC|nr:histidine kinase [Sinomonas gamaensis]
MWRVRSLGWGATAAAVVLLVGSAVLALMTRALEDALIAGAAVILAVPSLVLGWFVMRRASGNVVGPLLCLFGVPPGLIAFTGLYPDALAHRPGALPVSDLVVTFIPGLWMWIYVAPALLMLYFPTGRLLSRAWRRVVWGVLVLPVAFEVAAGMSPDPFPAPFTQSEHVFGVPSGAWMVPYMIVAFALLFAWLAVLATSASALVLRYRRSRSTVERAQLKWFALAAGTLPATLVLCWISYLTLGGPALAGIGLAAMWIAIPAAAATAVLRHRLYDVERLTSAALTYGAMTVGLLIVYTAGVTAAGVAVGGASPLVAALTTAVAAAALAPLRRRLRTAVDRWVYPARTKTLEAIAQLASRTHSGAGVPEDLEAALRSGLAEPALRLGFVVPGQQGLIGVGSEPLPPAPVQGPAIPVVLDGRTIGSIYGAAHTSPALLREVAAASALLVEVTRLRIEVRQSLHEAEASRKRLQQASYAERERLERDLHDGAQQRLVSLGMALRIAQGRLKAGHVDVDGLLDETVAELATAVAELRALAHGLRPSCLDDGLAPALASLTRSSPIPIAIDVRTGDLPDDVATTAYFVIAEAVANAVKHGGPARIGVEVAGADSFLTVRVTDDGCGGAKADGAGLSGVADRVAAAGGTLRIHSPAHAGTLVEAVLPCAS